MPVDLCLRIFRAQMLQKAQKRLLLRLRPVVCRREARLRCINAAYVADVDRRSVMALYSV